ncbi:Uncharacterized protein SCG7086_AH_00070 [Chlamydiales bacterium SCGC AG-110-P3]|nr:Uncharacterized protein SCG7086_AH_00070 [Chlamydiales bacterium SCGC AG-110-P3]
MTNFQERIIFGGSASLIAVLLIILSFHWTARLLLVAGITALATVAVWEYYKATEQKGYQPIARIGTCASTVYCLSVFLASQNAALAQLPMSILWCTGFLLFGYHFIRGNRPVESLSITTFGIVYITIPISFLIAINFIDDPIEATSGRYWLLYLVLVTKSTDTAAYFIGRSLGRRPLAPILSPKKTVEGAVGGTVSAIAMSFIIACAAEYTSLIPSIGLSLTGSVLLGAAVAITAQVGDLSESLIKRDTGVKDSNQLPGLGGILDVADSLIFTGPMLYLLLSYKIVG